MLCEMMYHICSCNEINFIKLYYSKVEFSHNIQPLTLIITDETFCTQLVAVYGLNTLSNTGTTYGSKIW
jgi:hypothetical protein